MIIKTAYLSHQGGREKNDDTVCIMKEKNSVCAFVGDGLGGYDSGKIASQTAAEVVEDYRKTHSLLIEEHMQELAFLADEAVKQKQMTCKSNMKTTLVVLEVQEKEARWMHVGDSRLYHFQDGKRKVQTMDHSVSQVSVLMGEITQEQIRFHEDRNRVLRALGSDNAKPDVSKLTELSEETSVFLLCTDGFWEYVYENEMEETLKMSRDPEEWLLKMQEILLQRVSGGNDNYTAAAVFCETSK